jgi:hypothetical protein
VEEPVVLCRDKNCRRQAVIAKECDGLCYICFAFLHPDEAKALFARAANEMTIIELPDVFVVQ